MPINRNMQGVDSAVNAHPHHSTQNANAVKVNPTSTTTFGFAVQKQNKNTNARNKIYSAEKQSLSSVTSPRSVAPKQQSTGDLHFTWSESEIQHSSLCHIHIATLFSTWSLSILSSSHPS
jgi:hypothetical protein